MPHLVHACQLLRAQLPGSVACCPQACPHTWPPACPSAAAGSAPGSDACCPQAGQGCTPPTPARRPRCPRALRPARGCARSHNCSAGRTCKGANGSSVAQRVEPAGEAEPRVVSLRDAGVETLGRSQSHALLMRRPAAVAYTPNGHHHRMRRSRAGLPRPQPSWSDHVAPLVSAMPRANAPAQAPALRGQCGCHYCRATPPPSPQPRSSSGSRIGHAPEVAESVDLVQHALQEGVGGVHRLLLGGRQRGARGACGGDAPE